MIKKLELVILVQTLVAAEQGSFQKAGELLGVPASTVSRRVGTLEDHIGVKLFDRHRHGIRPTAASAAILKPIQRILDDLDAVLTNGKMLARGGTGVLTVGLYTSPSAGNLRNVIREYKAAFPNVELHYLEGDRHQLMDRLHSGSIDVAILAGHFHSGVHDIIQLWQEKIMVALASSHHLAAQESLTWDDLRQERIVFGRDPGPDLRDQLIARLRASGAVPAIRQLGLSRDILLSVLDIEDEITLLYEADTGAQYPGIVYRDILDNDGPSLVPYFACWVTRNDNPALQHFLDVLRQYAGSSRLYSSGAIG